MESNIDINGSFNATDIAECDITCNARELKEMGECPEGRSLKNDTLTSFCWPRLLPQASNAR